MCSINFQECYLLKCNPATCDHHGHESCCLSAAVVAFLVSAGANYISGENIHVNGGMYMA